MTLRDFLKANRALIKFKTDYHEQSKTKITYRQIEANLLTAGEDFIKKALNLNESHYGYWMALNAKWNDCYVAHKADNAKKQSLCVDKTFGNWLKTNKIYKKFKKQYIKRNGSQNLDYVLKSTDPNIINSSLCWRYTDEGSNFWLAKHNDWGKFCKNNK